MRRLLFITGTDTAAGKTALTGLLLARALQLGQCVRAIKPFCSGERTDALLLEELLDRKIALSEINPWFFAAPIAPWTAARQAGQTIQLGSALAHIRRQAQEADLLLVEGAGGLLTPLGENFAAADLITQLNAEALIAAPDRLGVLNQSLLPLEILRQRGMPKITIALGEQSAQDRSCPTNFADLTTLAAPAPVVRIPFLENYLPAAAFFHSAARQHKAVLDLILG